MRNEKIWFLSPQKLRKRTLSLDDYNQVDNQGR